MVVNKVEKFQPCESPRSSVWLERLFWEQEAVGSNPTGETIKAMQIAWLFICVEAKEKYFYVSLSYDGSFNHITGSIK